MENCTSLHKSPAFKGRPDFRSLAMTVLTDHLALCFIYIILSEIYKTPS
jgi:hypothetical protein